MLGYVQGNRFRWAVAIQQEKDELYAPLRQTLTLGLALLAAAAVLVALTARAAPGVLVRPILEMSLAADRMSTGVLDATIAVSRSDDSACSPARSSGCGSACAQRCSGCADAARGARRGGGARPAREPHPRVLPSSLGRAPTTSRRYESSTMCRNIRVLYHFDPPTTAEEVRAAALQFVRKVSGLRRPSAADAATFERAVDEIAASTGRLLGSLEARTAVRTRERERERARARGARRDARAPATAPPR